MWKKRGRISLNFALYFAPPQTELFCKCVSEVLTHAKDVTIEMTPLRVFLVKLENKNEKDTRAQILKTTESTRISADACLAASIFHYETYTVDGIKEYLRERGMG